MNKSETFSSRISKINLQYSLDTLMIPFLSGHTGRQIKTFLKHFNSFDPRLKFTHESSKENLPFLDLKVKLLRLKLLKLVKLVLILTSKVHMDISIYTTRLSSKPYETVYCV